MSAPWIAAGSTAVLLAVGYVVGMALEKHFEQLDAVTYLRMAVSYLEDPS